MKVNMFVWLFQTSKRRLTVSTVIFYVISFRLWPSNPFVQIISVQQTALVSVDDVQSDLMQLSCGVLQRSLLGPLLYLCYSNDMVTSVKKQTIL